MPLKVILLDFDGVIIESNAVKTQAFERVFKPFPSRIKEIMDFYGRTTGIRFIKFRFVYENILGKPYTPEDEVRCAKTFAEYSIRESIRCPYVKGAREFLDHFFNRVPMYLISINPPEDLSAVLKGRGIEHYFKKVFTPTETKTPSIREVLKSEGVAAEDAVFIGDTLSDHKYATEAGVPFIGRQADDNFARVNTLVFPDLVGAKEELLKRI